MSKKLIIITAAVGLLSAAGMFVLAWLTNAAPAAEQTTAVQRQGDLELMQPQIGVSGDISSSDSKIKRMMIEKQLKGLIFEVRERIEEYDLKLKSLLDLPDTAKAVRAVNDLMARLLDKN